MRESLVLGGVWVGVGVAAYVCARLTRPDRNYHPMQRVIWSALAFVGIGAGGLLLASALFGGTGSTLTSRLLFAGALLTATLYSIAFMRRRNHTPRYLPLNLGGQVVYVDREHLRQQSENVTSLVAHGAAPEAWVTGLEEACAEWRRKEHWKTEGLPGQLAARRRAKGQG